MVSTSIGTARTPEDGKLELIRRGHELEILVDGRVLMSSRLHGSEEAMAKIACHHVAELHRPRVLVGGLGLGYTLRAALDRLPETAEVVCVELMPEIVEWHSGPLGPLADHPLDDHRVRVVVDDLVRVIQRAGGDDTYDVVLLDVDNGPIPFTVVANWWLYAEVGLKGLCRSLAPRGVLVVWSAGEDERFARRMTEAGLETEVRRVKGRTGKLKRRSRGESYYVFIGRKPGRPDA